LFLRLQLKEWTKKISGPEKGLEDIDVKDFPDKNLVVMMTTDKGLCGGVNTILGRMTRQMIAKLDASNKDAKLVVLGDKGRAQMRRVYGDRFVATMTERRVPYNFDLASSIAQDIISGEYGGIHIVYNTFKSAISYIPSIRSITPLVDPNSPQLTSFEVEPENDAETLQNFHEYTLATQIYYAMLENATSEQSSRMNAMENASKNANEMINKLTLQYNRARQARITTELIEIISGASALKG
jgi:F-type H+-transporting ATPase subunit gamma